MNRRTAAMCLASTVTLAAYIHWAKTRGADGAAEGPIGWGRIRFADVVSSGSMQGGDQMPSVAYEEIFQRIHSLTPEGKKRLIGFLRFDNGRADIVFNSTLTQTGKNGTEASPVRRVPVKSFDEERKWISQHREHHRGQFVALVRSQLLAHGADEGEVIDQARRAGVQSPFVTYIETEAEERCASGLLRPQNPERLFDHHIPA